MRHSNKERDNVAESRPGSNTVTDRPMFMSSWAIVHARRHANQAA